MTQAPPAKRPVLRFAPSPNGHLHLGHALSALLNLEMARKCGGTMLLRIEDIDRVRCTPKLEKQMLEDLEWIGFEWDSTPRRQSEHFAEYRERLDQLEKLNLLYPSFATRAQLRELSTADNAAQPWPRDPDGAPFNPASEKVMDAQERHQRIGRGDDFALRLDLQKALHSIRDDLVWSETGPGPDAQPRTITANPAAWGDFVIARKDTPTSYHLSCVHDDERQGITTIVRGQDLFHPTSVHRLLQELLGLPAPQYFHHKLVLDAEGKKLSKSRASTAIRHLRESGTTPAQLRQMIGLDMP